MSILPQDDEQRVIAVVFIVGLLLFCALIGFAVMVQ